ncbi:Gfo/Idh/MocA family oxidoreductase [Rhodopirellula sp.]|jgi:predicted dehydrogenase|nr:Gfo/Idh/MocA family oxidoreductase [Rhodopirellula sp.]MDA9778921.1 Gfo/Idh/MocA family oxidoreductase [Rubripirellula sp.]
MPEKDKTFTPSKRRFGVLGTGRITRRLIADLQSIDEVEVTAIASREISRAKWCADQHGIPAFVQGYENLIQREDVDAIYIALPPSLHYPFAIATAENKKDLLCEKPFALNSAQMEAIDAAFQKNRWLDATGWLHHPRTQSFANWLKEGSLGKISHLSAALSFYQPFQSNDHRLQPELGGGCLLDLGWYIFGFTRFFMRQMPRSIYADAIVKEGVTQRVNAMLWFENDVTASISCGYDAATRKWFEVAGSAASLICDDFTRPWHDRPTRCWIHEASGKVQSHSFEGNQEQQMIKNFISGEPLRHLQNQAIDTQRMIDAATLSIESGSKVDLPVMDR